MVSVGNRSSCAYAFFTSGATLNDIGMAIGGVKESTGVVQFSCAPSERI